ncbi:MAG: hypothetical protein ACI90V_006097 [Bacillariaceae sp.]
MSKHTQDSSEGSRKMEEECDAADEETTNNTFHPPPPTPEGFSVAKDVVSEEAWEEIRSYLGLRLNVVADNNDDDDDDGVGTSMCTLPRWNNDIQIIDLHDLDGVKNEEHNNNLMDRCRSSSEIMWESTPPPQNRPVAQFGFRYDYERDIVVVPIGDENLAVPIEKCDEKEDNKTAIYDDGSAKVAAAVPKIPELFKRLLLRPYYIQSSGIGIQDDGVNDDDENENEIKTFVEIFTQCIVNVYRPTTATTSPKEINRDNNEDETTTDSSNRSNRDVRDDIIGSHIPWHVDDHRFGHVIIVFTFGDTFGETRPLNMRLKKDNDDDNYDDTDNDTCGNDDVDCSRNYSYFTAHPPHRSCYKLLGVARTQWEHSIPAGTGWRVSITFRSVLSDAVE